MSDEKTKREMMAAHLGDLISCLLRGGNVDARPIADMAERLTGIVRYASAPYFDYRVALGFAGLTPEQIDAAVASIERGEWPADSLVGRVTGMRDEAEQIIEDNRPIVSERVRTAGAIVGRLNKVLALLGVKP